MTKTKALVKFDFDVAVISALDAKYKDIQEITDGNSKALVMEGLAEYRELRLKIDTMHKGLKEDILKAGRALDGDKTKLKGLLAPGENRLKDIRKVWDDEKDRIKAEKEAKERERVQAIQNKILSIHDLGLTLGHTSAEIKQRLTLVTGMYLSKDIYEEFMPHAIEVQKATVEELEKLLNDRLQFEKEEEDRKAETIHLERIRKEQEEAQRKIDEANRDAAKRQADNDARMAAEQAKIDNEKAKLEVDKKAEVDRKEKEEWEKDEKARILLELEERKAEVEQKRVEKEEAEAKEKERQEALRPDREKLIKWMDNIDKVLMTNVILKSKQAKEILEKAKESIIQVLTATEVDIEKL